MSTRHIIVWNGAGRILSKVRLDDGYHVTVETVGDDGRPLGRETVWADVVEQSRPEPATAGLEYRDGVLRTPDGTNYNLKAMTVALDKVVGLPDLVKSLSAELDRTKRELGDLRDAAITGPKDSETIITTSGRHVDMAGVASKLQDVPAHSTRLARLEDTTDQLRRDVSALAANGVTSVSVFEKLATRDEVNAQTVQAVQQQVDGLRHEAMHAHEKVVAAVNDLIARVQRLEEMHQNAGHAVQTEPPKAE